MTSPQRNKIIAMALAGWFVLAAAMFGWFSVESKHFESQWDTYEAALQSQFERAETTFSELAKVNNKDGVRDALVTFANDLGGLSLPSPPQILGITMGADKAQARRAILLQKLPQYRANLSATATFMEYQQTVAAQLQTLALSGGEDEASIRALAQKWQQAETAIKDLAPPDLLAETHATLTNTLGQAQSTITELADLYTSGNAAAFKTKYDSYLTHMGTLRALSGKVRDAAQRLDQDRSALSAAIKQDW